MGPRNDAQQLTFSMRSSPKTSSTCKGDPVKWRGDAWCSQGRNGLNIRAWSLRTYEQVPQIPKPLPSGSSHLEPVSLSLMLYGLGLRGLRGIRVWFAEQTS